MASLANRILVVVEDRHAEHELRSALESLRGGDGAVAVLTGDALLAMRLRREGIDARLTIDGLSRETLAARDRIALDGVATAFGDRRRAELQTGGRDLHECLEYTLIPAFVRAVRNVTALDDQLADPNGPRDIGRLVLAGTGPLIDAARLVAGRRGLATQSVGGDVFRRASQAFVRLRAGRATKWVNTEFRALVLEPGFILLLFLKGLWRRLMSPASLSPRPHALVVAGDRFTADVVERLHGQSRPIVLAGATQPGRALFNAEPGLLPIETFAELTDVVRGVGALADAAAQAIALARDRAPRPRLTAAAVPYWPLVGRTVWLHLISWLPLLRHLQSLTERAARACPDAQLLVSTDVTAYSRVLVEAARRFGIHSTGIQHGITGESNGHSVVRVDTLAAWGDMTEQWYRALAPQTAQFVVTGNPRFDPLAARVGAVPNAKSPIPNPSRIQNPQSRIPFTIVICTGFHSDFSVGASEYENLLMIDAVLAWAATRDDVRVIHKMHPGEESEYYAEAARALEWDRIKLTTIREPILYDVLEKADVLVAAYSTTVLESLVLGTPAIVFDAVVQRHLLPLDRLPGVSISYSVDELRQQLEARRAAPPPDRHALRSSAELRKYISALDGKAAERVAALVGGTDLQPLRT